MKTLTSLIVILTLFNSTIFGQDCTPNAGQDTLICGFEHTLHPAPEGGSLELLCDGGNVASIQLIPDGNFLLKVGACGTYQFEYTYASADCNVIIDTVSIDFEDPSNGTFEVQSNISLAYGDVDCPSPNGCGGSSASLSGGSIGAPMWEGCYNGLCLAQNYEVLEIINQVGCEADEILCEFQTYIGATDIECNSTLQDIFVNNDNLDEEAFLDWIINNEVFNELLEDCPINAGCFFPDISETCIDTIQDTSYLYVPIYLGGGQWTYLNGDMYEPLMDTTNIYNTNGGMVDSFQLIIEPGADYFGPDDIELSMMEYVNGTLTSDLESNILLTLLWQENWTYDTIQWISTVYEVADSCIGCSGYNFINGIGGIPSIPDFPCGPISIPFGPDPCDDDCPLTIDIYDEVSCSCQNIPPDCDDGCNFTFDYFDDGACQCVNEEEPGLCDDGCPDTEDFLVPGTCDCITIFPVCDDGCSLTSDYYDPSICECVNEPPSCDDGDPNTIDIYNASSCECDNIENPELIVDISFFDPSCENSCDGGADVIVAGGTPPYIYSWSDGNSSNSIFGLCSGSYEVSVTDANGFGGVAGISLFSQSQLFIQAIVPSPETSAGAEDGSISLELFSFDPPYDIQIDGPTSIQLSFDETTFDVSGLPCGAYNLIVTNAFGCFDGGSFDIECAECAIEINPIVISNDECNCDGIASVEIENFNGPATVLWTGPNGQVFDGTFIEGLCEGTYNVEVEDANNCIISGSLVIENSTPVCDDNCDLTNDFYDESICECVYDEPICDDECDLTSDFFDADACGCVFVEPVCDDGDPNTIDFYNADICECQVEPSAIEFTVDVEGQIDCANSSATLIAVADNPGGDFEYEWIDSNGDLVGTDIQYVATEAGTYTVFVIDPNSSQSASQTVEVIDAEIYPEANAGEDFEIFCDQQGAYLNGEASDVGAEFIHEWLGPNNFVSQEVSPYITEHGTYVLIVSNTGNSCFSMDEVEVTLNTDGMSVAFTTNNSCVDSETGSLFVEEPTGNAGPFLYSLNNEDFFQDPVFQNLASGEYVLYVQDAEYCTFNTPFTIEEIPPLELEFESEHHICGDQTTVLDIQVNQDANELSYQWSDGSTSPTLAVAQAGNYMLAVSNGCESLTREFHVFNDLESYEDLIYVPNAFSPNGDSFNDEFKPMFPFDPLLYEFVVFDRWGANVFQSKDLNYAWNGTSRSTKVGNQGVYTWYMRITVETCEGQSEILKEGNVALVK